MLGPKHIFKVIKSLKYLVVASNLEDFYLKAVSSHYKKPESDKNSYASNILVTTIELVWL